MNVGEHMPHILDTLVNEVLLVDLPVCMSMTLEPWAETGTQMSHINTMDLKTMPDKKAVREIKESG